MAFFPIFLVFEGPGLPFHGAHENVCISQSYHQRRSAIWTWQWKDLMSDDLVIKVAARPYLGGGFKYFLVSSLFGKDSHFDEYFSV